MTVYTVRFDAVTDGGCETIGDLYVYDNLDEARAKYEELLNEERQYVKEHGLYTEETENSFSSWEEGSWSEEHTDLSLYEDNMNIPFASAKVWEKTGLIYWTSLS